MTRLTAKAFAAAALLAGTALAAAPATAQSSYPDRTVEVTVPYNPGGGADTSQRTFNKYAEPIVGQSLVVVNKPGAGGTRGWAELVRQKPDGYSLAIETPPFTIIPALVKPKQTGYTLDQLTHICIYAVVPDVLVVREDSDFATLADLVDYAKANPKKIKAANSGTLGADFMTTLLIESKADVQFTQVPFTGGSQALQATLAGTTDAMVASAMFAVAQAGKLKTLAIASEERDPAIPDVPTFKELGYNIVSERYRALAGPPGLPEEIVAYWADVCKQVSDNPDFRAEMLKLGQPPAYRGPEKAAELINTMTDEMTTLVAEHGLAE